VRDIRVVELSEVAIQSHQHATFSMRVRELLAVGRTHQACFVRCDNIDAGASQAACNGIVHMLV
jgi:hypothetical protein